METYNLICGDALSVLKTMPAESVHMVCCSPPYWGLRDYGLPPIAWGGDVGCEHEWGEDLPKVGKVGHGLGGSTLTGGHDSWGNRDGGSQGACCRRCGAWRGCLGLEPTVEMYVQHLVEIFREVRRVLRPDGTLWLNLGDSYAGSGKGAANYPGDYPKQSSNRGSLSVVGTGGRVSDGLKPKDLCGIPWRVALALQADGWWLRSDIIWCLSGGARVYVRSQKGDMPMSVKDLVRLKPGTVSLWNGKHWTEYQGYREADTRADALEIELRSGERIGCTSGHEWPTQRGLVRADNLVTGDVIQECRLPDNGHSPSALADDLGWYVGHYLAEGSRSGTTIQISCHAKERVLVENMWTRFATAFGGSVHAHAVGGDSCTVCLEGRVPMAIIDLYVSGRTAKDKGLKVACWNRSNRFLEAIAEGYLIGDGHWDDKNERFRLGFTRNDRLAADLRALAARIGARVRLKPGIAKIGDKPYLCYRGEWRRDVWPHQNVKPNGEVVAIRKSRARRFYDIAVADDPHLFALASGILTHNSKPNPMPESVQGSHFTRHRVTISELQLSEEGQDSPTLIDCPGCDKCADGFIFHLSAGRPTRSHEYIFLLTKSPHYFYDAGAIREPAQDWGTRDRTNLRRGTTDPKLKHHGLTDANNATHGRNKRTVWTIPTQAYLEAHFATYPEKLVEPCIMAGTSEWGCCQQCGAPWVREKESPNPLVVTVGWRPSCRHGGEPVPAIVLDPFAGSGTVGVVAARLGRRAILIEMSEDYCAMARRRTAQMALVATGDAAMTNGRG